MAVSLKERLKHQLKAIFNNAQSKQVFYSFIFRLAAIACNIVNIRLLLHQLESYQYGMLVTVISITTWFTFVDLGLTNGLRNKISQSLAIKDYSAVQKYITTGYTMLFKVVASLSAGILVLNYFIEWNSLLKGPAAIAADINALFLYGTILFLVKIFLEVINSILVSFHKAGEASFIAFLSQFFILAVCYMFKLQDSHSFLHYGLAFFWVPVLVLSLTTTFYFFFPLRRVKPGYKHFDPSFQKGLLNLGGKFFIIQLASLIIFTTDNLIIGRVLGYEQVSGYNIAFRLFNLPILFFSIIIVPYWPLFAELFIKKEQQIIRKKMRRLLMFLGGTVLFALVLLVMAPKIYYLWVGETVKVPFSLSLGMFLFCIVSSWDNLFITMINSTSKLKIQLLTVVFAAIINIPLAIAITKFTTLGSSGVIFASCISLLLGAIIYPIQCRKLINRTADGIWNK